MSEKRDALVILIALSALDIVLFFCYKNGIMYDLYGRQLQTSNLLHLGYDALNFMYLTPLITTTVVMIYSGMWFVSTFIPSIEVNGK